MPITLTLRHLWTRTEGPLSWESDGLDEGELRQLLAGLAAFKANPEKPSAVLIATDQTGAVVGAWNREGAADLARKIWMGTVPPRPEWLDLRNALEDAVSGP